MKTVTFKEGDIITHKDGWKVSPVKRFKDGGLYVSMIDFKGICTNQLKWIKQ